eukprot:898300-Prorocentrum_lima.AAC.1
MQNTQLGWQRMATHRATYKSHKHYFKLYQHVTNTGIGKFYIELLKMYPRSSKVELLATEGVDKEDSFIKPKHRW